MKLRNLTLVIGFATVTLFFSSCTDESENILPQPVGSEEVAATVGTGGEDGDPMD